MKKTTVLLFALLGLISCKNETKQTITAGNVPEMESTTSVKEMFKEGKIEIQIHFPDNPLSSVLNKIDPAKGDIQTQMETLSKTLSKEDAAKMNKVMKGNPLQGLQILFAPLLKNEIFVKGDMATAKCDGLMYHLENQLNGSDETGKVFIQSQENKGNQVSFTYDKDFFGQNQIQTKIDMEQYSREQTDQTQDIAGYACTKAIYTPKANTGFGVGKLEVWTSPQMPKSLNFIHPYYLEEDNGIMKINIFFSDGFPMVYEFKNIMPRAVTDNEMAIKASQPIYDSKTQEQELGLKLMGILFGAE
jgi:hypothetical protein